LAFAVFRADGDADERQILSDITDPPGHLPTGSPNEIIEIKFEWNFAASHIRKIDVLGILA